MNGWLLLLMSGVIALDAETGLRGPADGCAQLADTVFLAVLHEALPGQVAIVVGSNAERECSLTAATVSRAFTSAMARLGASVSWGDENVGFCTAGDVRLCRPVLASRGKTSYDGMDRFIDERWHVVQVTVSAQVVQGVDRTRFTVPGLQRTLAVALSAPGANAIMPIP